MEAIAEPPALEEQNTASYPHDLIEAGKATRITPNTAAEMSKRRWEREKAEKEAARNPVKVEAPPADVQGKFIARQVESLMEGINDLDKQMEGMTDPDAWHKLTTSRSKLFEQWRILSGIPMPGSRKPAADKPPRQRPAMVEPS